MDKPTLKNPTLKNIAAKSFMSLGFAEGLTGAFTALAVGNAAPGIAGVALGTMTLVAGVLMLERAAPSQPQPK